MREGDEGPPPMRKGCGGVQQIRGQDDFTCGGTEARTWKGRPSCFGFSTSADRSGRRCDCNRIELVFYAWSENTFSRWKGENERRSYFTKQPILIDANTTPQKYMYVLLYDTSEVHIVLSDDFTSDFFIFSLKTLTSFINKPIEY